MGKAYRPLHALNGDFLSRLKRPLCSEFSTTVQGKLNARNEEHRKRVELMFKDRNLVINRVKRSQDATYKTLLRVHKQQKLLERELYKKQQESLRLGFESKSQNSEIHGYITPEQTKDEVVDEANVKTKKHTVSVDPDSNNRHEDSVPGASGNSANTDGERDNLTHKSKSPEKTVKIIPKSRVLEARKNKKESPIVRERSLGDDAARTLDGAFPNISDIVLPTIQLPESTATSLDRKAYQLADLKKTTSPTKPPPPKSYLKDKQQAQGMEPISEEHSQRSSRRSRKHSYNSSDTTGKYSSESAHRNIEIPRSMVRSWPSVSSKHDRSGFSSGSGKMSQVELNKRRAAEKEAVLRDILAKEPVTEYVQDSRGHVVPDIKGFYRKTFEPPSLREKHQQHKLLRSEVDATIKQKQRIHSFFDKMELEDEEKAEFRRRHLAKMSVERAAHEEAEREAKRNLENLGSTLTQLMAAFNRPAALAEGVDPDSMEALEICKYVRRYEPLMMSEEERKAAKTNRISSWDHVTQPTS